MELIELPRHQSESLLRSGVVGRVAFTAPDGPHVIPVNYSVVDESVVFRTSEDSLMALHAPGATIAFEVDQFDYENHRGWSVVARGEAHRIYSPRELEHVLAVWEPRPWAGGSRHVFLKFGWEELSGRRLGAGWSIEENLLVKRMVPTRGPGVS